MIVVERKIADKFIFGFVRICWVSLFKAGILLTSSMAAFGTAGWTFETFELGIR